MTAPAGLVRRLQALETATATAALTVIRSGHWVELWWAVAGRRPVRMKALPVALWDAL
jgi:hypothetical protein